MNLDVPGTAALEIVQHIIFEFSLHEKNHSTSARRDVPARWDLTGTWRNPGRAGCKFTCKHDKASCSG